MMNKDTKLISLFPRVTIQGNRVIESDLYENLKDIVSKLEIKTLIEVFDCFTMALNKDERKDLKSAFNFKFDNEYLRNFGIFIDYEGFTWRCALTTEKYEYKEETRRTICLKLINDGFIYSKSYAGKSWNDYSSFFKKEERKNLKNLPNAFK